MTLFLPKAVPRAAADFVWQLKKPAMYKKRPRCKRSEDYFKIRDVRIRDGQKRDERDLPVCYL